MRKPFKVKSAFVHFRRMVSYLETIHKGRGVGRMCKS